jgi:TP901 family phage tail tape measure protein
MTPLELESLSVKIVSDFTDLTTKGVQEVEKAVLAINKSLETIAIGAASASTAIQGLTSSISQAVAVPIATLATAVGGLGTSFNALSRINPATIGSKVTTALNNICTAVTNIAGTPFHAVTWAIGDLTNSLKSFGAVRLDVLGRRLAAIQHQLVPALRSLATVDLTSVVPMMQTLAASLDKFPAGANINQVGMGLSRLAYGANALSAANMTAMLTNGQALLKWVGMWSSLSPQAMLNIGRVGRALSGFAAFAGASGGGGLPPINLQAVTANNRFRSSAESAGRATRGLTANLRDMSYSAGAANGAINMLRLSLAGLAGVGLALFAKFDDALTRTMAHMQDWGQESRGIFENTATSISSVSTTGAIDLAKGLDILASSGMNAAMSAKALTIAETFAVASGMRMEDATKRIVDAQRALGMGSENVETHYGNMIRLSDLLIGMSRQVGATEDQMAQALSGKFAVAMKMANMSVEDGIALLGAYSERSSELRGSHGGDVAARLIMQLGMRSTSMNTAWKQLGIKVFDGAQGMKAMVDIVDQLEKKMGHLGSQQQFARLISAGIESRTAQAIVPIIGMSAELRRLQDETKKVGDVANKTAEMMRGSFLGQLRILWNNITNVSRVVGQVLAPVIGFVAETFESLARAFTSLNPAVQQLIIGFTAFSFLVRPVTRLVIGFMGVLFSPLTKVISGFMMLGGVVGSVASFMWNLFTGLAEFVGTALLSSFKTLMHFFTNFSQIVVDGFGKILTAGLHLIPMIVSIATNIIPFILSMGTMLTGVFAIATFVVAAVATIGLGVSELASGIRDKTNVIWDDMKGGWREASDTLAANMKETRDSIVDVWTGVKDGIRGRFEDAAGFVVKLAGFFWNIKDNAVIIFDWMRRNWRTLITDIGELFFALTENMAKNFRVFFNYLVDLAKIGFGLMFGFIGNYAGAAFAWLRDNWKSILSDMGSMFATFGKNLLTNWLVIAGEIGSAIWDAMMGADKSGTKRKIEAIKNKEGLWGIIGEANRQAALSRLQDKLETPERLLERMDDIVEGKGWAATATQRQKDAEYKRLESIFRDTQHTPLERINKKLVGPMEGFDSSKLSTNQGTTFGELMRGATIKSSEDIKKAQEQFTKATEAMNHSLVSPIDGFEALTENLIPFLKLDLPPDAGTKMQEAMRKFMAPFQSPEDSGGNLLGKGGPGFTFKQLSETRFMTGGQAAETLDYQQLTVLKSMDNKLGIIAAANEKSPMDRFAISPVLVP